MIQTMMFETDYRDAACAKVLENAGQDWQSRAVAVVRSMDESEVTGEDIRLACEAAGVRPHHHNAWGAFIATLKRDGLLEDANKLRAMRAPGSHARKTMVYRLAVTHEAQKESR